MIVILSYIWRDACTHQENTNTYNLEGIIVVGIVIDITFKWIPFWTTSFPQPNLHEQYKSNNINKGFCLLEKNVDRMVIIIFTIRKDI